MPRILLAICMLVLLPITVLAQDFVPVQPYGGQLEFMRFLKQEMVYPPTAINGETEGTVTVFCIVGIDGSTRDVRIFKGVCPELDAEALRIFRKIRWKPAIQADRLKASEAMLDFPFSIKRYKRWCKRRGFDQPPAPDSPVSQDLKLFSYSDCQQPPAPELPDGVRHIRTYLAQNIQYPQSAAKYSIEGTAIIGFVVEPNGNLSNVHPIKYLGGGCTEEVTRLLHTLKWIPGAVDQQAVRTEVQFTMTFALPESQGTQYGGGVSHTSFQ